MTADSEQKAESVSPPPVTRFFDRLLSRYLRLPPSTNDYAVDRDTAIAMSDGVTLLADHYIPKSAAPAHTVLIRSPYGRGYPFPQFYARPLVSRGFHVVVQSVRGTYGSGGTFEPAIHETADGQDTLAWLGKQPWFTGRLATIGASYLGMVQWALMMNAPAELAAAVILVAPHDLSSAWATGSFALDDNLRFCHGVADPGERARLSRRLRNFVTRRPAEEQVAELPLTAEGRAALGAVAPLYESWLAHPDRSDPFWDTRKFTDALDRSTVPTLLVSGWQDTFIRQTLEQYRRLRDRGIDVGLTVGPWTHERLLRRGARTFVAETLDWVTAHLVGNRETKRAHPIRVFVTGHGWIELPRWPPAMPETVLFLGPSGELSAAMPPATASASTFTFDPADPTPTVGGPLLVGGGYCDDTGLAQRVDVLSFTTEPLAADMYTLGSPMVELVHSADIPHVDLFIRLSQVDSDGRSSNVSDGYRRLVLPAGSQPSHVDVELDPIAHCFPQGARIRMVVAGGCHPRFARNAGTGEPVAMGMRLVAAEHRVHHGAGGTSRVLLPAAGQLP